IPDSGFNVLASRCRLRTLLSSEVEHDVGLGNAPDQPKRAEVLNHRQSLRVHFGKPFQSFAHSLKWRDPWELFVHEISRYHHLGEFRLIEKLFDVMQRDGAEQLFFFPDYVNMLQPMLHKCLGNLSEGSIAQKRDRVASNKICDSRFGQLLFEE